LRRVSDYPSPLLVADRLYELIRFSGLCLVDWSEWRPNVFFEMGVRLAVHPDPPHGSNHCDRTCVWRLRGPSMPAMAYPGSP
jgi:hypothetical protein